MLNEKKVLAVIPARGGSKGIRGKNLRTIRGLTLVARAARTLAEVGFVDRAVCSTDDPLIAREAELCGLRVDGLRPSELATDEARSVDVWRHAWLEAERVDGLVYDLSILVEPTSPLRRAADLAMTLDTLLETGAKAAATLSRTPSQFTPHKTLTVNSEARVGFYREDGRHFSRRQDVPSYFYRNGACYAAHRPTILEQGTILEEDCIAVVIERPLVNVDDLHDLDIAEYLASREAW